MSNYITTVDSMYKSCEKDLLEEGFFTENEIKFLKDNYNITKDKILNSSVDERADFSDQLIDILESIPEDEEYKANLASAVLLYFNFYKTYGDKIFDVSVSNMNLAFNVFDNIISGGEKQISDMSHVIDPIVYCPDIIDKFRSITDNENMVAHYVEYIVESNKGKISRNTIEKRANAIINSMIQSSFSQK